MRSFRFALIIALLLASKASHAAFTGVSNQWSGGACLVSALSCSVGFSPATGAGHVIIVYAMMQGANSFMVGVTGGGTYTICTVCGARATSNVGTTNVPGATDIAYTTSSVAGAVQVTVTRSASGFAWRIGYWEISTSANFRAELVTGGNVVSYATGTALVSGVNLASVGPNALIMQTVLTDRGSISINPADNAGTPGWTLMKSGPPNYAMGANSNAANGVFYWRFGSAGAMIGSAIAFREVSNVIAPPLPDVPHTGLSAGTPGGVGLTSGVDISAGPPAGAPALTSVTVSPATATLAVPGSGIAFTATGTWADGSTGDVTSVCNWFDNAEYSTLLGNPTFVMSDAHWFTLPMNQTAPLPQTYARRGNPQTIHFAQNGIAVINCRYPFYPGNITGTSTIQIGALSINPFVGALPTAVENTPYSVTFTPTGGTPPYTYQDLSPYPLNAQWFGLLLTGNTLAGTPPVGTVTIATTFHFALRVTDSATPRPNVSMFLYTIVVSPTAALSVTDNNYYDNSNGTCRNMGTGNDGPAALPTACFNTSPVNTPSPGATFTVPSTTYPTIQSAFNAIGGTIPCGSTISIASTSTGTPGGVQNTYEEPNLTYPPVACDAAHWMTITTDQALPPEGTRISPAWLGIASLLDRPAYNVPTTLGVYMPKICNTIHGGAALKLATVTSISGSVASYVRFRGLNFVQPGPTSTKCVCTNCQTGWQGPIVDSGCGPADGGLACPDHVIFDHVIVGPDDLTGTATFLVCDGVRLTGRSMAVVDSYVYELAGIHGFCETHGIGFGNTDAVQQGPYKVVNNFVEGGAENYLTGGGHSASTPSNIQIRRNHLYKPENLWKPGAPGYLGTPMLVKNLGEFKNALQALIEGNIYQHSWYGNDGTTPFTDQFGYGLLLNASSNLTDVHRSFVQDVTLRYNVVQHTARGIEIDSEDCRSSKAVGCGIYPPGATPTLTERISVHDNLFDDVSPKYFTQGIVNSGIGNGFDGSGFSIINSLQSVPPVGILNSVTVNHNTVVSNSYRQNFTVASITVTGTTATLTTTAAGSVTAGQRLAVFGACTGFNDSNATVLAVTQTTPVLIFTYTTTATGTCNQGFVGTLGDAIGGAFNIHDGASDGLLINVSETGTLAQILVDNFWLGSATRVGFRFCVAVGTPAGCTQAASFTIYGLTGNLVCYNNNQSAATCPPSGTPATWTMAGTVACTGAGTGDVIGNATATACATGSQSVITWTHPISGLTAANANARSYASYWLNLGPDPNPGWQNIVITNNLVSGRVQLTAGYCQNGPTANTSDVLSLCGVLVTTGPGAYNYTCNLVAERQLTGQGNIADVLPTTNKGITDFNSVGFVNYNSDNLGLGVTNPGDLAIGPGSPYFTGIPGCDGLPTGANITQIQTYTTGVL